MASYSISYKVLVRITVVVQFTELLPVFQASVDELYQKVCSLKGLGLEKVHIGN